MTRRSDIDDARSKAYAAAQKLCSGGDHATAGSIIHEAQMDVIRRLVSATLPGGEAEFWDLVAKDLP